MGQIYGDIKAFVKQLAPRADLITEFNGNFMYLIPTQGFNAAQFYTKMEANKATLHISDWGLCQSSLEDVFTRIYSNDGGNLA